MSGEWRRAEREYKDARKLHERVSIRMKTLKFNENVAFCDLFKLTNPALGIYVTPAFIKSIKVNQLTGFAFESIDEMNAERHKA